MSRGIASLRGYKNGGSTSLTIQDKPSWAALGVPEGGIGQLMLSPEEFAKLTPQEKVERMLLAEFHKTLPLRQIIADSGFEEAARKESYYPKWWSDKGIESPASWSDTLFGRRQALRKKWSDLNPSSGYPIGRVDMMGREISSVLDEFWEAEEGRSYRMLFPENTLLHEMEDVLLDIMGRDITDAELAVALDDPLFGGPLPAHASDLELEERVYARRYADAQFGAPGRGFATDSWVDHPLKAHGNPLTQGRLASRIAHQLEPELEPEAEFDQVAVNRRRLALEDALNELEGTSRPYADPAVIPDLPKTPLLTRGTQAAKNVGIRTLKAIRNKLPMVVAGAATVPLLPFELAAEFAVSPTGMGSGTPDWRRSEGLQDRLLGEDIYRTPEEREASGRYRATQFEQLEDFLPYTGARLPTGRRVGPVRPR